MLTAQETNNNREALWQEVARLHGNPKCKDKTEEVKRKLGEIKNVNTCGMYIDTEVIKIPSKDTIKIEIVQGNDGKWRFGKTYLNENYGLGSGASIFSHGHETKIDAILAAAKSLKERIKLKEKENKALKEIDSFISNLQQPSLF